MPKKVDLFAYVHPKDLERGRGRFELLLANALWVTTEDCPRGLVVVSSLDLLEDKADWKDYGGILINEY